MVCAFEDEAAVTSFHILRSNTDYYKIMQHVVILANKTGLFTVLLQPVKLFSIPYE